MPATYTALPSFRATEEADRELDEAFESDDDLPETAAPLATSLSGASTSAAQPGSSVVSAAYDFEREYDAPPPGSPPRPSALALPNDYGNSNGAIPAEPVHPAAPSKPSFFRRVMGTVLPTHYARLPSEPATRTIGGGTDNDGVFTNVQAKPSRSRIVRADNGSVQAVMEDVPPSYAAAQADAVPPYWETTVHAPSSALQSGSDMIIDDLPLGSTLSFVANLVTSFFFQFIGFLFTYILHTSHAAKYGSRAGLGLTLIQFGFYSRTTSSDENGDTWPDPLALTPAQSNTTGSPVAVVSDADNASVMDTVSRDSVSFVIMTLGWFILFASSVGFWRVKHWESSIRASSRPFPVDEETERDTYVRRQLHRAFGLAPGEDGAEVRFAHRDHNGQVIIPAETDLQEARLERSLRAAGLL